MTCQDTCDQAKQKTLMPTRGFGHEGHGDFHDLPVKMEHEIEENGMDDVFAGQ